MYEGFSDMRDELLNSTILYNPDFSMPFCMSTYLNYCVLGVDTFQLFKAENGNFEGYFLGYKTIVYNDHKALSLLLQGRLQKNRFTMWARYLHKFHTEVIYIKGVDNIIGDILSH
ncbi:uncharacterized protein LOC126298267 [Schistocerca gregaria]|uniref:uncharacterized protein LOC126298267 n=1 Tax=Schistocerca gregaria TaxID=7010 RepID=UPI00211E3563|nr:uncharacterized protein LOC126298267 [Schistocerca gregaria]